MEPDQVAAAFAAWVEAHKRCVECENRLKQAQRVGGLMGGLPPRELVDECSRLKAESDRLLAIAQEVMRASRSS